MGIPTPVVNGRVTGPLGAMYGSDPHEFALAAGKALHRPLRDLTHRLAARTGWSDWTVSIPRTDKRLTVGLRAERGELPPATTLRCVLWGLRTPAITAEEAIRMALGMPRGLDNDPTLMLEMGDGGVVSGPTAAGGAAAGAGGVSIGAVVLALIAIAPQVLPPLLEFGGEMVGAGVQMSGKGARASSKKGPGDMPIKGAKPSSGGATGINPGQSTGSGLNMGHTSAGSAPFTPGGGAAVAVTEKPWYMHPAAIAGGLLIAGGAAYAIFR